MKVTPFDAALGAEVTGVDLAADLDADTVAALRAAWAEHIVLCVRDQELDPAGFMKAGKRFGTPFPQLYDQFNMPDYPEIGVLTHMDGDTAGTGERKIRGTSWHTDASYFAEPPKATMLHALEIPSTGGDTDFLSCRAAYEALDAATRRRIDGLKAVHVYESSRSPRKLIQRTEDQVEKFGESQMHPIARTHPETGRKAIYLNPIRVERVEGLAREESDALLDALYTHMMRPEFQYRHKWRQGDFVIWDNRAALHQANDDYDWRHERRKLYRIMLEGERPA